MTDTQKQPPVQPSQDTTSSEVGDQVEGSPNLEQQVSELQAAYKQKEEAYRRALADYQNLRRQCEQEKQRLIQFAGLNLIEALLPTLDHVEMAARHLSDPAIQMVKDEFLRTLQHHGLETVPVEAGQEFDHQVMEAIDTQEGPANEVLEVVQVGYQLNGQVVRHAKVIVGKEKK